MTKVKTERGKNFMKNTTIKVKLETINDVNEFVRIMTFDKNSKFDADIQSERYLVNAKSIMGLFSLNLSEPVTLVIHDTDTDETASAGLLKALDKFIVK